MADQPGDGERRERLAAFRAARDTRREALADDPDALADARARLAARMADDWDGPVIVRPEGQRTAES